jgi:hypothetical protein
MICRFCNYNLSAGDIYEVLKKNNPTASHESLLEMAKMFGWTPENKKEFSKVLILQDDSRDQIEICPECKNENP